MTKTILPSFHSTTIPSLYPTSKPSLYPTSKPSHPTHRPTIYPTNSNNVTQVQACQQHGNNCTDCVIDPSCAWCVDTGRNSYKTVSILYQ
jgi:hypothetical protein